jgi:hypothetical protein
VWEMTDRELLQKSLDILSFIDTMGFTPMILKKEFLETLRERVDQPEKTKIVKDLNEIIYHLRMEIKRLQEIITEAKH